MILKSSLYDYRHAFILVTGTTTIPNTKGTGQPPNNNGIEVVFKNCTLFTDCISEINNLQIHNSNNIDVVMPIYNLIQYGDNYSKTLGRYYKYASNTSSTINMNHI